MVASSASPHGPWLKLGAVARALNDGSWNERLVDSGRALQVQGKRGYYGIGFVTAAREKAGHVEDVEGVYRTCPACRRACLAALRIPCFPHAVFALAAQKRCCSRLA